MTTNTTKRWTEQEIHRLVQTNDRALYGALMELYRRQTASEQKARTTRERNGRGFNAPDANFLTSVAIYFRNHGYLTFNQRIVTRKKIAKYTKQLTKIANKEA